ncbi:MAG TPA: DegT/DnrJ/EryC1/StrS family aminotransferase, partial [Candidatus Anoxymicrobiaceae bacterium]
VDKETTERYKNKRAWEYDVLSQGYRYHMTNILASVGISQIKRVVEFIDSRVRVCTAYTEAFSGLKGVITPSTDYVGVSPFIYSLRVPENLRAGLIEHLGGLGIDTGIHFIPVHEHTFYPNARRGGMEVTDRVTKQVVTLPLHSNMRPDFVERVIEGVTGYFS